MIKNVDLHLMTFQSSFTGAAYKTSILVEFVGLLVGMDSE
jgi:hypothetical protein